MSVTISLTSEESGESLITCGSFKTVGSSDLVIYVVIIYADVDSQNSERFSSLPKLLLRLLRGNYRDPRSLRLPRAPSLPVTSQFQLTK